MCRKRLQPGHAIRRRGVSKTEVYLEVSVTLTVTIPEAELVALDRIIANWKSRPRATCTSRRRRDPLEYRRPITGRPQSRTIRGVMAFGSSQADASRAAATMPFYIENLTLV